MLGRGRKVENCYIRNKRSSMGEYTVEELKGLQKRSLEMAKYFVDFCEENGLLCYFCGGGCIGAIRHQGFIPWDDDLDFFMPRRDYERLVVLWRQKADTERYELSKSNRAKIDRNLFLTIRDSQTTQIKPYQADLDIPQGIPLDVLPLDGYPDTKLQRICQCFWALVYSVYCAQSVPENHGRLIQAAGKVLLGLIGSKDMRYIIWKFAEKQMTKYSIKDCDAITELCSGPHYMKKKYPKSAFETAVWKKFEDVRMPVPVGYDEYLKIAFGDYMEMPPKEKQKPHHDTQFLDVDNSYKRYKGIYYCRGERS